MSFFNNPDESYDSELSTTQLRQLLEQKNGFWSKVIGQIPPGSRVLDIGVGSGILARLLKLTGRYFSVDGIEPNEYRYNAAKDHYGQLFHGYSSDFLALMHNYDYLVMCEVIEHTVNPDLIIQEIVRHKRPEACLICTTPNIAHGSIRAKLMRGYFEYANQGILDKTHLRFFTQKTLNQLLESIPEITNYSLFYSEYDGFLTEAVWSYGLTLGGFSILLNDPSSFIYQFIILIDGKPLLQENKVVLNKAALIFKYIKLKIRQVFGLYPKQFKL